MYDIFVDNVKLLKQIGEIIDKKLDKKFDQKLEPIKQDLNVFKKDQQGTRNVMKSIKEQLNNVEMKVELVNKRVEQAQQETIESLTDLINGGYDLHEVRIKRIEDHLDLPQI